MHRQSDKRNVAIRFLLLALFGKIDKKRNIRVDHLGASAAHYLPRLMEFRNFLSIVRLVLTVTTHLCVGRLSYQDR